MILTRACVQGSPSEDDDVVEEKEADDEADSRRPDTPQYPPLFTAFSSDNYKVLADPMLRFISGKLQSFPRVLNMQENDIW